MTVNKDEKLRKVRDEIKLVSHLHNVIKNGLLGRNEPVVIGEEPSKRFFSGVLFPDFSSIISQQVNEAVKESQPVFKSLSKNHNIGLEFLIEKNTDDIELKVSGSFQLYLRVFPSYEEQMEALQYLETKNKDRNISAENDYPSDEVIDGAQEEDEDNLETESAFIDDENNQIDEGDDPYLEKAEDKGLKLLEKFQCIDISFENIPFKINVNNEEYIEYDLQDYLNQAIENAVQWNNFFNVHPDNIDKTGVISLSARPTDENIYNQWVQNIKSKSPNLPQWIGKIGVEARSYRSKEGKSIYKVVVSLINNTIVPNKELKAKPTGHSLEFFDCQLRVKPLSGIHQPFEFDGAPRDYKYDKKVDARGINCVGLHDSVNKEFITESIPKYFQKHYRTREDLTVKFKDLIDPSATQITLINIATEMRKALTNWKLFIDNKGNQAQPLTNEELKQCELEMVEFEKEIKSFELGIYCLTHNKDKRLMTAFNLLNEVFIKSGGDKYESWRLFQIIFIVRIIPSLFSREVKEHDPRFKEVMESNDYADVLWFPTGGGKTEAYLGLIVCSLFFDRLRGKKRGCSTWIRFPLRMLSKQQLDRIARVLIFAEQLRQTRDELSTVKGSPFSIGFFAGGGNTPNFINESKRKSMFGNEQSKKKSMILHKCPYCNGHLSLDFDEQAWRVQHKCNNNDCFVVQSSLNGVLPIYITDSEVYRFIPSVLCGTVDKLAIMARYREFAHIFGQVGGLCDKHGFYSDQCFFGKKDVYGSCDHKQTSATRTRLKELKDSFYDPVPALLIQDELHLLKEELGALDGHYEGALIELARSFGRRLTDKPKVIAATATIESYERHINHLYIRQPRKYPSMGYIQGESFYATSTPEIDRRLYIGVLPHAKSQEEVIGRCLYLYQKEIYRLYNNADDEWSQFGFEGISNRNAFIDLLAMYDLSVVYVNKKPLGHDILRRISETTNPNLRKDIGQPFDLQTEILTGENEMDKIVEVIDRIESEKNQTYDRKLHTLIATSLISHGVDLDRINAFFMAGTPSKQAEYIQASSRSARSHVGLVIVCFKPNDLRERSQYQYFIQNHIFLDRLVDPVPINRMSLKAIERSLSGLIAALLYCVHSQRTRDTISNCNDYNHYVTNSNVKNHNIEQEIIQQLKRIIGTDTMFFSPTAKEKAERFIEKEFARWHHLLSTSSGNIKDEKILNPITSFRDIEEGLRLTPTTETAVIVSVSNRE